MATLRDRFSTLFRARVGKYESATLADDRGIYGRTISGSYINESSALGLSTVYACTSKIASTIATLGLEVMVQDNNDVLPANAHPSYDLIRHMPNSYQTAYEFWETIVSHAVLAGVGYAIIERDNRGYGTAMHIVANNDVDVKTVSGQRVYSVRDYGVVMPENMLEICNMHRKSPIALHRENLGLARSAQEFGSEYFGSGGQMTGILSSDQPLKKEQVDVIQDSWNKANTRGGTKLLPFGFRYSRVSITPDEAQFIETRKFQSEEICRIFSVPPALVQLESQTTYNNVEQQNLMFARHTITPWAKRIEQEIDRKLLQSHERPQIYSKFSLDDLYRGDMQARASFYTQMLNNGVFQINEVRKKEGMNPVAGGDVTLVQVNQIALDRIGEYSDKISSNESGTI
jgi:HK97 family phage portal protein